MQKVRSNGRKMCGMDMENPGCLCFLWLTSMSVVVVVINENRDKVMSSRYRSDVDYVSERVSCLNSSNCCNR